MIELLSWTSEARARQASTKPSIVTGQAKAKLVGWRLAVLALRHLDYAQVVKVGPGYLPDDTQS
jgi:hypothetical protein